MNLSPFALERWLARWDTDTSIVDIAASGVEPVSLGELLDLAGVEMTDLRDIRLDYGDTRGVVELRSVISDTYEGMTPDQVLVTCGAIEALFLVISELVEPGDEVVVPVPGYQEFGEVAAACGATVVPWPLVEDAYDVDGLSRLLTRRTTLVVVNSPHNPTGAVMDRRMGAEVYALVEQAGAYLLVDEVSRWLERVPVIAGVDLGPRAISVGGVSKALGLPGLRIGWMAGPTSIVDRCWARRDYTTLAPGALDQVLAMYALRERGRLLARSSVRVHANLQLMRRWSDGLGLVSWTTPHGGVAGLLRYDARLGPSAMLVESLAERWGVLLAPGSAFGIEYALRVGMGGTLEHVREGVHRLGTGLSLLSDKTEEEE